MLFFVSYDASSLLDFYLSGVTQDQSPGSESEGAELLEYI
uniref:Uncharacterized protein n=1 Tax=Moniliophthora roreri TaxID=221103 RepID=A0A0W0FEP6_MONRR